MAALIPKYDRLLGATRESDGIIATAASDPTGGIDGQQYINSGTNELKVYFCGSWQTIFTFTCTPLLNSLLLLEDGFYLLLETGDKLILE